MMIAETAADTATAMGRNLSRRSSSGVGRSDPESAGLEHQLCQGVCFHLAHHASAVHLHRDDADSELRGNLFVHPATDDQLHDLPLAAGESGVSLLESTHLRIVTLSAEFLLQAIRSYEHVPHDLLATFLEQDF